MESGKVYVISIGNNLDEGMTKEQIIAAIAEATGETPTHVDDAFITKLKEQNKNSPLKIWVGTQAEYNRIETPAKDTLYIITDVNELDEFDARLTQVEEEVEAIENKFIFSTDEQRIGTWIDGKPLYRKTVDIGSLPNNTTKNIAHGISNIDAIISFYGFASNGTLYFVLPSASSVASYNISAWVDASNVHIETGVDRSSYSGYMTLEYTKTTD